jgi:hydroxyethylthiazole kinase-like uncharacterized protein yjeF
MKSELLTAMGVRIAEGAAIEAGITEEMLMERAGKAVAEVVLDRFSPCQTIVLCGPGKNGGDAQVMARHLKEKGWSVEVFTSFESISLKKIQNSLEKSDLIVDGLLGTGLSRPLEGEMQHLVDLMNAANKPIVAIDIPTGIGTDSGASWGRAIQATMTVTFLRARVGHFLLPGRLHAGELFVRDIGIPEELLPSTAYYLNGPPLWQKDLKEPQPSDHKYTRGACLVIGNGSMPGAVRLASLAVRRIGAGLVRMTCKSEDYPLLASTVWGDIVTPVATEKELLRWAEDARFQALLWGAGAPPERSTRERALLLLSTKKPCVLDGGALSSFEGQSQMLMRHLHEDVVLTPHEGEFRRLFPHLASLGNKAEKALKAASETGAIIVLKGYDTVIASPEGKALMNANAPATLATAGTGDVLAGMIAGLLAQSLLPLQAAAAAVWIQGAAAGRRGLGLIAEDLLDDIPGVLQGLLQK